MYGIAAPDSAIQVIVRVRPWSERKKAAGTVPVVQTDNAAKVLPYPPTNCSPDSNGIRPQTVSIVRRDKGVSKQTKYSGFAHVLTAFTTQREVYALTVGPLVQEVPFT